MILRTRLFEIAEERGVPNDLALALLMGVSPGYLSRVRRGERPIRHSVIQGAKRAFPDLAFEDVFSWEQEPTRAETETANVAS